MGMHAEDLYLGRCCMSCAAFFFDLDADGGQVLGEHGYPVLCHECWPDPPEREAYPDAQEAHLETL